MNSETTKELGNTMVSVGNALVQAAQGPGMKEADSKALIAKAKARAGQAAKEFPAWNELDEAIEKIDGVIQDRIAMEMRLEVIARIIGKALAAAVTNAGDK